jgi:cobalt-zinc-cadmium efflux system outer membrane protein
MKLEQLLLLPGLLALGGCLYHVREETDQTVRNMVAHPLDLQPPPATAPPQPTTAASAGEGPPRERAQPAQNLSLVVDAQTTALMQAADEPKPPADQFRLTVPPELPGAEAPPIRLPPGRAEQQRYLRELYGELVPLAEGPRALPGPGGRPYTLADLQQLAAANSPTLRQAASDVEAARGNLIQARTYPNPNVGIQGQPSNNGETTGVWGVYVDQPIKTGGKLKLQSASAQKDLENAELALKRARGDLATQVRTAYFALLAARETVRVTRALAVLTDEVYRLQLALTERGGFAAAYEPAALRAQAYAARLALSQATATYALAWKQLVAAVGLRQLPLSEVAGRIDASVPYFDYDVVLAHALQNHTDVLTARNVIDKARYNLKLAQVTPHFPDVDAQFGVYKEFALAPFQMFHQLQISAPLPVWDRNRGNIIAAEAALARAVEEPHRVEVTLTNNLATAYTTYRTNLDALEYYRRHILPDQVRAYRGVLERRQVDPGAQFGDLVAAQQALATNVTAYLAILGQLWTGVVGVADLLQTDDLFQLSSPYPLPPLPDLEHLPPLPCCHPVPPPAGVPQPAAPFGHCPVGSPPAGVTLPASVASPEPAPALLPPPLGRAADPPKGPSARPGDPPPELPAVRLPSPGDRARPQS